MLPMTQQGLGDPATPSGSSPKTVEPASGLDASHSIPIAQVHHISLIVEVEDKAARDICGLLGKEILPGVLVVGSALSDLMATEAVYEDALQTIASGDGDAREIANQALERADEVRLTDCPMRAVFSEIVPPACKRGQ